MVASKDYRHPIKVWTESEPTPKTRHTKIVPGSWAEEEFSNLPIIIKESICICDVPEFIGYHWLQTGTYKNWFDLPLKQRILRGLPGGMFCRLCLKPSRYSVFSAYQVCEGCGIYYVPRPIDGEYPIRYFICTRCDVPASSRPRRKLREGEVSILQSFDFS